MRASFNGHTEIVEILLNTEGINVNMQNKVGYTALMKASSNGYTEIVKMLLNKEYIDVNIQNNGGRDYFGNSVSSEQLSPVQLFATNSQNTSSSLYFYTKMICLVDCSSYNIHNLLQLQFNWYIYQIIRIDDLNLDDVNR